MRWRFYDLDGAVQAETGGGAVTADRIGGNIAVRTAGGDITLGAVGGNATCATAGGTISAALVRGEATFETGGGDIRRRKCAAWYTPPPWREASEFVTPARP